MDRRCTAECTLERPCLKAGNTQAVAARNSGAEPGQPCCSVRPRGRAVPPL